jgi:hypothetical protein
MSERYDAVVGGRRCEKYPEKEEDKVGGISGIVSTRFPLISISG